MAQGFWIKPYQHKHSGTVAFSTKNPVFSSLMLRSYPAKQEGAVSSVILGMQIAVCILFIPACAISMGLQLGNHKKIKKTQEKYYAVVQKS